MTEPGSFHPKTPFHMVWLATNVCNARCLHCSSNSAARTPDELSFDEVLGLIDQLVEGGVVDLAISGGEPLLRRDLFEIIAYARGCGLSIGVGSNGANLTERQLAQLSSCGLSRFQVSLDGLAGAHDALRCWPGLFDRAIRTIELVAEAGIRTHVCCTINRLNVDDLESFTEFVSKTQAKRINFSRFIPTGRGKDDLDLKDHEWHQVIGRCVELKKRYRGRLEIVSHLAQQILVDEEVCEIPGYIGCQAGIGQGCVTANGTVWPCVLLPIPIGNIRLRRFKELWISSPIIQALQSRATLEGTCGTCHLRSRCGGCRAVAYAKTGNYLAPDPRCVFVNSAGTTVA